MADLIPVDPLPTAPSRKRPSMFSSESDDFLASLPEWGQQVSDLGVLATAASVDAVQASATAVATIGSQEWVSGATYAVGDVVWSPTSYLVYRRKAAGTGTVDPMSDGTNWEPAVRALTPHSARTSNTELGYADNGSFIDITSGTFTQTFASTSLLGAGWHITIRNSGTGTITLDPFSTDAIDGAGTYLLPPYVTVTLGCNGSSLKVVSKSGTTVVRLPIFSELPNHFYPVTMYEDITPPLIESGTSAGQNVYSIIYGNGLFIAAFSYNFVRTSPDGLTWTSRTLPSSEYWSPFATNGTNKFIISTNNSTLKTASSTDGITWALAANPPAVTDSKIKSLAFVGDRCLALYTGGCSYSDNNGVSWSANQAIPSTSMVTLYSFAGLFISPITGGGYYTSTTGVAGSWTLRSFPVAEAPIQVRINQAGKLQVNFTSYPPYETTDGINWTLLSSLPTGGYFEHNGVPFTLSTTVGSAKTYHNGIWAVRKSTTIANPPTYNDYAWNSDRSVLLCVLPSNSYVLRIDSNAMSDVYAYFGGE